MIRDLKIGTQLKIGFGIILMLIFFLSTLLWWQTNNLVKSTRAMYEYSSVVKQAIGALKYDVLDMRFEYRNFLLATDESKRSMVAKSSQRIEEHFNRQLSLLEERYKGPKQDIENIRMAYWKWVELRNSNFLIKDQKDFKNTLTRLEPGGDVGMARTELLKAIQVVDDFASNESAHLMGAVDHIHQYYTIRLVVIALLTILLTIFIIFLILRNIRIPLRDLLQATKQFNEGHWKARCQYFSGNEFGELATSYNNLVQLIESELEIKEKANEISRIMLSNDEAVLFGERLIGSLLDKMDAQMGVLHLLNDEKTEYRRFASIGLSVDEVKPVSVRELNGIIGTTLATGKLHHFKKIPPEMSVPLTTLAGEFSIKEIITIPIFSGPEIIAVMTLYSVKEYSENSLRLLQSLLDTISARLVGILTYRKVMTISEQLEIQNAQLELQKKELYDKNEELERQKIQLDEASKLKTVFLSNMSHELRTPLNSVIALSGLLNRSLSGKVPEREYSYLDVIERNGKQLLTIINSILDFSKIESGKEVVTVSTLDLKALLLEIIETIHPQILEKGITLEYQLPEQSVMIESDYQKCFHIVQNIISNAVKFTNQGGVKVLLEKSRHNLEVRVEDTGIGMPSDFLPYVFEEFRQADDGHARNNGGTGLGMAIAQKYAQMLGGSILVESDQNKGSVFTFLLPLSSCVKEEPVVTI